MPTPKQGYYLKDGTRVPGTTTVIGRFKDSGGLIQWAYKQGREHESLAQRVRHKELSEGTRVPSRLYEVVEEAADIGTMAHWMVEQDIRGNEPDDVEKEFPLATDDMLGSAWSAFKSYESWKRHTNIEFVETEIPLVSEKLKVGGTPDIVAKVEGELCMGDVKTSSAIYPDHLIQVGGSYIPLWNENFPDKPITGGTHILRFSKKNGDFAHHYYPDLSEAEEAFRLMRRLYDIDKQLKERAK